MFFLTDQKPDIRLIGMIKYQIGSEIKQYRAIDTVSIEWAAIATELRIKRAIIANARDKRDNNAAAYEVLTHWLGADTKATWARLIDAIKVKEELTTDAEELERALLNMINDD